MNRYMLIIRLPLSAALFLPLLFSGLAACSPGEEKGAADLTGPVNRFGFALYSKELPRSGDDNLFISPASIFLALAMTWNGAAGSTEEGIAETLHIGGSGKDRVNAAASRLISTLTGTGPGGKLIISNSIWLKKEFSFRKGYIQRMEREYGAGVFPLTTAGEINGWVSSKTEGKIDRIVEQVSPMDLVYLINAIYFKGAWKTSFDSTNTVEDQFSCYGGESSTVAMMKRTGKYAYLEGEDFQAVCLPYTDGRTSMYIFLPGEDSGIDGLNSSLEEGSWNDWRGLFKGRDGTLGLPRLKTEYETNLNGPLAKMGMEKAFGREADFSGMCDVRPGEAYIDKVLHKTFLEINEEGTEAAAVTSVGVRLTSAQHGPPPFTMILDRPFCLIIADDDTGLILFMGSIKSL